LNTVGLCIEPLDVLFFRDGRPFDAAARVITGLPAPQVLVGAVRTVLLEKYGCNFVDLGMKQKKGISFADALPESLRWIADLRFRGPWLAKIPTRDSQMIPDVFLPMPNTVHTDKKRAGDVVRVLRPLAELPPGWCESLRPLWLNGTEPTDLATGFIDAIGLADFLNNRTPAKRNLHLSSEFFEFDHRTGIGIDMTRMVTGDGEIFGIGLLSMKSEFGFYAEVELPIKIRDDPFAGIEFVAFGGEGKRARLKTVSQFNFPSATSTPASKRFLLLTTPCLASGGGVPTQLTNCIAAAVNSPVAFSGWDIARSAPKPTRFAIPAGSVYFFDTIDLPNPNLTDELGFGCYLEGVWTDG